MSKPVSHTARYFPFVSRSSLLHSDRQRHHVHAFLSATVTAPLPGILYLPSITFARGFPPITPNTVLPFEFASLVRQFVSS
mmetsp:Transcript_5275/g.11977  ORF Transcript_5275/g.11977 Transcript_5275/m.11977 type:complete len:81 (+) Transcript_5275:257-499(+)